MSDMSEDRWQQLVTILDGRIDELTAPLPSRTILRFAEAIRSATPTDDDGDGTYGPDDYANLLNTMSIVSEMLPPILASIRAASIDPVTGWRFEAVQGSAGDRGLCAICKKPFQHFDYTVKVHHLDLHDGLYIGVCRWCVGDHAPIEFLDDERVAAWRGRSRDVCEPVERDHKRETQRVALIDAIRAHLHADHYFDELARKAPEWAQGAWGEWR